jgi:hypothetical protein
VARTTESNKIFLQSAKLDGPTMDEAIGTGSKVYPGHLLKMSANGVLLHNRAYGAAEPLIAIHNRTPDTNTYAGSAVLQIPHAKGDTVYFGRAQKGDLVRVRIKQSESVTNGLTFLASDGAGHVQAAGTSGVTAGTYFIGRAWETISSAGSGVLVKMMVL